MPSAVQLEAARLVVEERWAALATVDDDGPSASMVAYAIEPATLVLVMHLSGLSAHTRQLLSDARASVAISRPDSGQGDPQQLPRVTLAVTARPLEPGSPEHAAASAAYLARFPDASMRFALADFVLFAGAIEGVRYVGGFARAASFDAPTFREALAASVARA